MSNKGYPGFELKVAAARKLNRSDAIMLLREEQALRKVQKEELDALKTAFMECVANKERAEHQESVARHELAQRINQTAQLSADLTGYRERLTAANKAVVGWTQIVEERDSLRAQVKALCHELDILATVLEMENSKTTKGYWLRDLGKQARAALKAQA